VPLLLGLVAVALWDAAADLNAATASAYPVGPTLRPRAAGPQLAVEPPVEVAFRPGQTVSEVLATAGLAPEEAHQIQVELARFTDLRRLKTTDGYAMARGRDGVLARFELRLQGRGRAAVERRPEGWSARFVPSERRVEVRVVSGRLVGSLEASIVAAGGEGSLAYAMADVLQWDLDFNRDLREGDRFAVVAETVLLDGEPYGLGRVLALTYDNAGRRLEAYRYATERDDAYYDGTGRPLQKMFLRSPLRFTRVTSGFSHRRFHPVLKSFRPHYGVDYGAPVGTPVRATAGGVVVAAGWEGGSGKVVRLRHANDYLTAYLHLSRFAEGVRPGARVQQGEVIGYVGSTGLATGPHLDYRVQRAGRWIDPLSIQPVPTEPIAAARLPEFLGRRDALRASLATGIAPGPAPGLAVAQRPGTPSAALR
jgi:murein DD-endopeptidase MepM/ murein hydrolase activator NlpD